MAASDAEDVGRKMCNRDKDSDTILSISELAEGPPFPVGKNFWRREVRSDTNRWMFHRPSVSIMIAPFSQPPTSTSDCEFAIERETLCGSMHCIVR